MLLLWLLCQLTVATAMPSSLSFATVWRILNTMNDTESGVDRNYHGYREQSVCETAYCNEIARKILQNRDTSVDPCKNFYKYACGSWKKHNPIPQNEVEWSEDQIIVERTYHRIKDVLGERDKPDDILPVKLARKLYRSCMDTDAIERRGIQPILEILDHTGGWPVAMPLDKWDPNKVSWQKIDKHYVRLIGNSAFYNLDFELDQNDTKRYMLKVGQDTEYPIANKRDLTKLHNDSNQYVLGIFRVIQAFAKAKGYTLNLHQLAHDVTKMVSFKVELLQILQDDNESHATSDNYKRMTIEELQNWYNSSGATVSTAKMNFLDVIQHAFKLGNVSIDASESIVVYNPEFLHKLGRLLGNTSRRVLVNYVQWNMVDKFLAFTTQEMREIQFNMSFSSYHVSNYMPRWKVCVLNMEMKHAVSYMFVKRYISDGVVDKAKDMIERIREELSHRIIQARWISDAGKRALTQKLSATETLIGYPDWYKDDQAVIEYYEGLEIGSDYFQNILNCEENDLIRNIKQFKEPVVRSQWSEYPITVNAFYAQTVNAILIPAAELQDPYFTPLMPDAINYGTTGFVIGHELSHSFDNEGIQFNTDGYKTAWVSEEVFDEYGERAECFVEQYDNYTLDVKDKHGRHVKLDGHLTENENIADSVGVQVAFAAYKKAAKQRHQAKLPGLENVSHDELFFLTFANAWCASARPEYEKDTANSDEHSPPKYRIIGSLSNMPAFSQTFNCPRNSPMNPRNKCNLWS